VDAGVYSTTIWAGRFARAQITASVAVTSPLAIPWVRRSGSAAAVAAETKLDIKAPNTITIKKAAQSEIAPRYLTGCIGTPSLLTLDKS
jgi:hypothetical protein